MPDNNRILSIDIMRGLTILLMLFLNDLNMPVLSELTDYKAGGSDGNGLADWLFPGFLFIAGMAIPYSVGRRISDGEDNFTIAKHIVVRSISLLIIGLLMLNSERVNPEFTGIGKNLWTILMFTGVFMIWNKYQETGSNFFTIQGLRLIGMALLVALVFKFRSGEFENNGSLITGSWGFLGLIGWGYLVAAFIYLAARDNIMNIVVALFFFMTMNILTKLDLLFYLDPAKPVFGVIIEGYIPMIVLSGTLTTMILKKYSPAATKKRLLTIVTIGVLSLTAGVLSGNYFNINALQIHSGLGFDLYWSEYDNIRIDLYYHRYHEV